MQTFLPVASIVASARSLDDKRLNKQITETAQILQALDGDHFSERALLRSRRTGKPPRKGWTNHPAVRMWRGCEGFLALYGVACFTEWVRRGGSERHRGYPIIARYLDLGGATETEPWWFGDPVFHESHQSRLVQKLPEHYLPQFPDVTRDLEYVWPEAA